MALVLVVLFVVRHLTGPSPTGPLMGGSPRVRKIALAAHVTTSVGWLGAVGAFLALALAGLTTLTVAATLLLLVHTQVVDQVAEAAAAAPLASADMTGMRVQLVVDAALRLRSC
ncbi:hypothetical protein [Amycolatopsis methanolica]|uniref:hypothetical protein n=1 Tax=Amycolatopsis methanolica TaxID=1814 RepID=UPI00343D7E01